MANIFVSKTKYPRSSRGRPANNSNTLKVIKMNPKSIKIETDEDYQKYLLRINEIWNAEPGTPEGIELDRLVSIVEKYEEEKYPIPLPDPEEAIKFRLEQEGIESEL